MYKTYNGWSNYETWCVNLHLTNDEYNYVVLREILGAEESDYRAGGDIKEYFENSFAETEGSGPFVKDAINAFLSEVNWSEIAENNREDDEEENEDDEEENEEV